MALVALWNAGLIMLAVESAQGYRSCVADGGIICFDFSGPIVVVMIAVDEVVAVTVWFVRGRRARRGGPSGCGRGDGLRYQHVTVGGIGIRTGMTQDADAAAMLPRRW